MNRFLFKQIDNIGLVLFRAVFGLLITIEAFGAIATGWVRRTLVETPFTFNFIGFDFLQQLQGPGMYYYFAIMGIFGIFATIGFKYRISMVVYAVMWTCVYLMQKSSYNNHYYLMMLLCWIMAFLPAHRWFSVDAKMNPEIKTPSMPRWVLLILILQVWIVYTYASVAKLYPDWLDASMAALLMEGRKHYWLIGDLLQQSWVHWAIAYTGILFDLLIVPLMLWKRTRLLGFIVSIFFHLFNSIVFQIGIFPYMSIAFALFFFSPEILRKRFLPKKILYTGNEVIVPNYRNGLIAVLAIYFAFQIGLPLRHWFFKDDVLWTEEGHRLSWRMMLRSKSGSLTVFVVDKAKGVRERYNYSVLLGPKQQRSVATKPDIMWQLAQKIKTIEAEKGRDVAVFMEAMVRVNNGKYHPLTNPQVDLAAEKWSHFTHSEWILPSPKDYNEKPDTE
ncbi:HTTM domain-containing protein [Aequorivita sp. SDUM287046]|uniref:HTTM domain-containing protein n=1 Tax=Aequorivita aurantiaca TaxID=3053356 RepID=A0ABT8DJ72_9FLAO|nr:HTTM domain-containing protein [Aequorivita aurantiaca]MDN3723263.1 HTTM domain-containing protein [Aequorivita aurantiaca]